MSFFDDSEAPSRKSRVLSLAEFYRFIVGYFLVAVGGVDYLKSNLINCLLQLRLTLSVDEYFEELLSFVIFSNRRGSSFKKKRKRVSGIRLESNFFTVWYFKGKINDNQRSSICNVKIQ